MSINCWIASPLKHPITKRNTPQPASHWRDDQKEKKRKSCVDQRENNRWNFFSSSLVINGVIKCLYKNESSGRKSTHPTRANLISFALYFPSRKNTQEIKQFQKLDLTGKKENTLKESRYLHQVGGENPRRPRQPLLTNWLIFLQNLSNCVSTKMKTSSSTSPIGVLTSPKTPACFPSIAQHSTAWSRNHASPPPDFDNSCFPTYIWSLQKILAPETWGNSTNPDQHFTFQVE